MIVHVIPEWTRRYYAAGEWKAVEAVRHLLAEIGAPVREITITDDRVAELPTGIQKDDRHLLMHYTRWPNVLLALRRRYPHLRLHVRTLNAEALHFLHQHRISFRRFWPWLRQRYGSIRLLAQDVACRRLADTLLGISGWDDSHYWRRLPGRARVLTCPYFSPWPRLRPAVRPRPWPERARDVVCMPGTTTNSIGRASVENLARWLRARSEMNGKGWRFVVPHPPAGWGPDPRAFAPELVSIGDCPEPWDLLTTVRAVAVLTPLGYGCKTTVTDAVAAGCHVLVHPRLWPRLEPPLRSACLTVDPDRPPGAELLARLDEPPSASGINETLQQQAAAALREALRDEN